MWRKFNLPVTRSEEVYLLSIMKKTNAIQAILLERN